MLLKILRNGEEIGRIKYENGRVFISKENSSEIRRLIMDNKHKTFLQTLWNFPKTLHDPYQAVMVDKNVTVNPNRKPIIERQENNPATFVREVFLGPNRFMGSSI